MRFMQLPSGIVINLEHVIVVSPDGAVAFVGITDDVVFAGADAEALLTWAESRPKLVRPPRAKKVKS